MARFVQITLDQNAEVFQQFFLKNSNLLEVGCHRFYLEETLCRQISHIFDEIFGIRFAKLHSFEHRIRDVIQSFEINLLLRREVLQRS